MDKSGTAFTHFFGEREETFHLNPKMIVELEQVTGVGIGTLMRRLVDRHFKYAEIGHVIRLALIGGGISPERAARLCETYVADRPITETYPLALSIMERVWFGARVVEALVKEIEDANGAP